MRIVRSPAALLAASLALWACGVDSAEHEALQAQLRELEEENRALEAEIARLRETDQAYWQEALEHRDKREWQLAAKTVNDLMTRWPESPLKGEAQKLLRLARDGMAKAEYEEAMTAIRQQDESRAKTILQRVRDNYPETEHARKARADLGSLTARMARVAREQEEARKQQEKARKVEAERLARASSDVELTAFSWHRESRFAVVEGMVKNISSARLETVQAVAIFTDAGGSFITSDSALIEYRPLLPEQSSPFKVYASWNPAMSGCRVEFKTFGGSTLRTYHSWR